jgi:hypothetical protein
MKPVVNSPLRNLPIRQVMGVAHYLSQSSLPEVPGQRRPRMARRAAGGAPARAYFHVVFTLPALIADIAYQNKAVIYGALFKASAETLLTIAADPKHLGVRIGITSVLHTWGSALTQNPHSICPALSSP